jgi:hypothetical protein
MCLIPQGWIQFELRSLGMNKRKLGPVCRLTMKLHRSTDVCLASIIQPAAQKRIAMLLERGFNKAGDVETRLGYEFGQLGVTSA